MRKKNVTVFYNTNTNEKNFNYNVITNISFSLQR